MRRIELLKQRHDLKIALRRTRNAIAKNDPPDTDNYPNQIKRDNVRTRLNRSLKKSNLKKRLRRTQQDPCLHSGSQWYTFSNPNCYNLLDEVIVEGIDKSKNKPKLNSSLVEKDNWWNKPIDVSFKNPWPEARWDWFEDRVSGNRVWGNGNGSEEFGNRIGKNSVIGQSYDMNEWVIPGGGGGNLKFWAHLDNWAKYGLKGIQTISGSIDQRNNVKSVFYEDSPSENIDRALLVKKDTTKKNILFKQEKISLKDNTLDSSDFDYLRETRKDTIYKLQYWKGDVPFGGPAYDPKGMKNVREEIKIAKEIWPEVDSVSVTIIRIK